MTTPPLRATHRWTTGGNAPVGASYLIELPNAPLQGPLNPDQERLSSSMRAAWASFAATGDPSTAAVRWTSFNNGGRGLLLVSPEPQVDTDFASRHHCSFWAAE